MPYRVALLVALTVTLGRGLALAADPGVTATEIKIGSTAPYSGPASAYGAVGRVEAAYFRNVNDEGGISGRKVNFVTLDDAYSPPKTVEMVRRLVEQEQVLLLFQTLGTASNTAIWKYVNDQRVPHLFVGSGATKFGDPVGHPWTMPMNPTYQHEGHIYAQYILKNIPDARIGILYQNDDYGKDYVQGLKDGLGEAAGKVIVLEQTYEVTDPTVDSQIVNLKNSGANVFFNVTTSKFAAQAIRKAHDIGWKPVHILNNVASSVAAVLRPAGFDAARGIITTAVWKDPSDPQWRNDEGFKGWLAFMRKYHPEGNVDDLANVYGYSAAQLLVQVLRQCGSDLSRTNVMGQAANIRDLSLPMLLPGMVVNTSPTDFYPLEQLQMVRLDGERWVLFGEVYDASKKRK